MQTTKSNHLFLAALLAGLTAFSAVSANALTDTQVKEVQKALKVPRPEIPAKSAQIVLGTVEEEREEVALTILKSVAAKYPASLAAVVGSICKAAPEIAPEIAAAAAKLLHKEIEWIAKAAVAGAPSQADTIAAAVAKTAPKSAVKVAQAVIQIVPSAAPRVLALVGEAVPSVSAQLPRVRVTAASDGGTQAIISVTPGTIGGTPTGDRPVPTPIIVVVGEDPDREEYGRPQ